MDGSSTGLDENVAGLLCYVLGWVSGVVFFLIEEKSNFVRFHAIQSIVVFGVLTISGIILGWIPFVGLAFSIIIGIVSFVLWVILMVMAIQGRKYKLPWAGDFAEKKTG
jgi:uncharacterized membrane protein